MNIQVLFVLNKSDTFQHVFMYATVINKNKSINETTIVIFAPKLQKLIKSSYWKKFVTAV